MKKDVIIFKLNKNKIILFLLGSILFIVLGVFLFLNANEISNGRLFRTSFSIKFWGILSVIFFGICAVYLFFKIFDKKPGLILDNLGITDNSSAASLGFVNWKDVYDIRIINVSGQDMIAVHLLNENEYLQKVKNPIKKTLLKTNSKYFGSSMNISAQSLKVDKSTLFKYMEQYFQKYKEVISNEEIAKYKEVSHTESYDENN